MKKTKMKRLKIYCNDFENIENFKVAEKDNFKGWDCHHRLETHSSDGERRLVDITKEELKALGMYWHRPASELIFLTKSEHHSLHNKDKPAWNKGKKCEPCSQERKRKLSEINKSNHWFNNGAEEVFRPCCPDGYIPGRLKQCKSS